MVLEPVGSVSSTPTSSCDLPVARLQHRRLAGEHEVACARRRVPRVRVLDQQRHLEAELEPGEDRVLELGRHQGKAPIAGAGVVEEEIQLPRNPGRDGHDRIEEAWLGVAHILGSSRRDQGQEDHT